MDTTTETATTYLDDKARDARILALAKSGTVLEDIGRDFNITRERVRQILDSLGYSRTKEIQDTHDKIRAMVSAGQSIDLIAAATKRPASYIDHFCRQHRLRPKRNSSPKSDAPRTRQPEFASALMPHMSTIQALIAAGKGTADIARAVNSTYGSVYSFRRTHNI